MAEFENVYDPEDFRYDAQELFRRGANGESFKHEEVMAAYNKLTDAIHALKSQYEWDKNGLLELLGSSLYPMGAAELRDTMDCLIKDWSNFMNLFVTILMARSMETIFTLDTRLELTDKETSK